MRAAERRLAAATAREGVAAADLYPRITISGFLGLLAGRGNLFGIVRLARMGGDAGAAAGRRSISAAHARACAASKASTRESVAEYEQVVLRALEETENALVSYREEQQRLVKLTEQARESSRAAAIARVRYREGAADFLALLDAERTAAAGRGRRRRRPKLACSPASSLSTRRWGEFRCLDPGSGVRDSGFGIRDSGFGIRDSGLRGPRTEDRGPRTGRGPRTTFIYSSFTCHMETIVMTYRTAILASVIALAGTNHAFAQEAAPGPGIVEVSIIPGGGTFFTEGMTRRDRASGTTTSAAALR